MFYESDILFSAGFISDYGCSPHVVDGFSKAIAVISVNLLS